MAGESVRGCNHAGWWPLGRARRARYAGRRGRAPDGARMRILYHHRSLADAPGIHIAEMVAAFRDLGHEVHSGTAAGSDDSTAGRRLSARDAWFRRRCSSWRRSPQQGGLPDTPGNCRNTTGLRLQAARPVTSEPLRRLGTRAFRRPRGQLRLHASTMPVRAPRALPNPVPSTTGLPPIDAAAGGFHTPGASDTRVVIGPGRGPAERSRRASFRSSRVAPGRVRARRTGRGIVVGWTGVIQTGMASICSRRDACRARRAAAGGRRRPGETTEQRAASLGMSHRMTITGRILTTRCPSTSPPWTSRSWPTIERAWRHP
jgi:hypothetical protein